MEIFERIDVIADIYSKRETKNLFSKSMENLGKSYANTCCCETGLRHDAKISAEEGEVNA